MGLTITGSFSQKDGQEATVGAIPTQRVVPTKSVDDSTVLVSDEVVVPEDLVVPAPEKPLVPPVAYAPDFTLPYLDGDGTFTLSDYRGQKPVIVDFFAEHCPYCRINLPILEDFAAQYKDEVEVVLIAIDTPEATRRYLKKRPTTLPIVIADSYIMRDYRIQYTNIKALIKKDGSLLRMVGGRSIKEQDFLDLLVSE